jgi:single-strand DNA-binding protein
MYLNKVIIVGNLTREPELKSLPSGVKVLNFGVATNRNWKDKEGNKKEDVEFHNIVAFGKQAEVIQQWVKKGDQIYLEGRLQTRNWEEKETGKKIYKTEIILETFQFGAKRGGSDSKNKKDSEAVDGEESVATGQNSTDTGSPVEISPDDIPF